MKKVILLFLLLSTTFIVGQNLCESKEESYEELNTITKCAIESSKSKNEESKRQVFINTDGNKTRFLKRRVSSSNPVTTTSKKRITKKISKSVIAKKNQVINKTEVHSKSITIKETKQVVNKTLLNTSLETKKELQFIEFNKASEIPVFKTCKNQKGNSRLACFNSEMAKHIQNNFNYPEDAIAKNIQGKVTVSFVINKKGEIDHIETSGISSKDGEILNQEAKRVVSKLPKFIPGKKDGNIVPVKYGFPIAFSL